MRVAVDAMGGDFGPKIMVEGALKAAQEYEIEVYLVGAEDVIQKEVGNSDLLSSKVAIVNAAEAIGMGEGLLSFRRKKRSSIRVGTQLVKDGKADAFVSTGNTAAVVYISRKVIGHLQGIEKPALSLLVPSLKGLTLLVDVGANVNCRPHDLYQFAVMGHIFMKNVCQVTRPRIALMSVGEEETKGNDLIKDVFERLQASSLNFIGNVEGKDIYSGNADVIVSDGFTGNIALKVSEGVVETVLSMARTEIMRNFFSKIGFFLMKRNLKKLYKRLHYAEYGGAPLLGLKGVCVIGHGRSNSTAVKNAIRLAKDFVTSRAIEKIQHEVIGFSQGLAIQRTP
jgi:glycerol-3-phosphate acyltransferase PlsX